jgi:hypothetical protein
MAAVYLIYGGIKIVLAMLDRNYAGLGTPIISVAVGVLLVAVAYAYRDRKMFGWYGLVGINGLVILLSVFSMKEYGAIVLLVLSVVALVVLFSPTTKSCFTGHR